MKLYELAKSYAELLEVSEEMDSEAIVDTLSALQDAIEDKAENIASSSAILRRTSKLSTTKKSD